MKNEATLDGEDKVLARTFGIRCSLHGACLLVGDILRKYFASVSAVSFYIPKRQLSRSPGSFVLQDALMHVNRCPEKECDYTFCK